MAFLNYEGVPVKILVRSVLFSLLLTAFMSPAFGQSVPLSEGMASTVMTVWKDSLPTDPGKPLKWGYEQGVLLKGMEGIWLATGEGKYFSYIQRGMDHFVTEDG